MKILNKTTQYSFLLALLLLSLSCSEDVIENRSYTLLWEDNFDGDSAASPDSTRWAYDIGTGGDGWGNQELQYYTDRPENVMLDGNGYLVITAREEFYQGRNFTSGRIKTDSLFSRAYGRFEARIKTPYGPGIWPAFWMLGDDIDEVGWPQCGEIDIMELRGQEPSTIHGSLHGPGYSGGNPVSSSFSLTDARFDTEFHVFAVEWGPNFIDFFVDDRVYQHVEASDVPGEWVYDDPFFLILNVAVGGNYVGFSTLGTRFPQTMHIDYVRVYEEN